MKPLARLAGPLALTLLPGAALAHPGHAGGAAFLTGLAHPVGGADHLLAMVAVGIWAAQAGGRALWAAPAAFVGAMILGAVALPGLAGLGAVEPMILASVILVGASVALALRPPLGAAMAALALFGLAHGAAHGAEGPLGSAGYVAGFALATLALHGAGIVLGQGLARFGSGMARLAGGATAVAGLALATLG